MKDTYGKGDDSTEHRAYTITDDKIIKHCAGENPFISGQLKIDKGIGMWRFNCLRPIIYWIGVVDAAEIGIIQKTLPLSEHKKYSPIMCTKWISVCT